MPAIYETRTNPKGYREVYLPFHPSNNHGWVLEHRLVVELSLGIRLPSKLHVHHRDRRPTHNVRENLLVCPDSRVHDLIHTAIDSNDARSHRELEQFCLNFEQSIQSRADELRSSFLDYRAPGPGARSQVSSEEEAIARLPSALKERLAQVVKRLHPARKNTGEPLGQYTRELTLFDSMEQELLLSMSERQLPSHLIGTLLLRRPSSVERQIQSLRSRQARPPPR
ncbi:HNH endonuclease [Corallococcus sp. RDP092CA]